jgi:GTP pyrophosphokinase
MRQVVSELRDRLADLDIHAQVQGRPKHYWSIYEKMIVRGKEFDDVQDLVGVRVVVDSVKDCYGALGSIHALWAPILGRFKDYIAMPKFNLYQSLHTTVIGPQGKRTLQVASAPFAPLSKGSENFLTGCKHEFDCAKVRRHQRRR